MKLLLSALLFTAALMTDASAEPPAPRLTLPPLNLAPPPAIPPQALSSEAGESPKPGVYLAAPWRLLVRVPEARDELMLHGVPPGRDYSLRSLEPTGQLTPWPSPRPR